MKDRIGSLVYLKKFPKEYGIIIQKSHAIENYYSIV